MTCYVLYDGCWAVNYVQTDVNEGRCEMFTTHPESNQNMIADENSRIYVNMLYLDHLYPKGKVVKIPHKILKKIMKKKKKESPVAHNKNLMNTVLPKKKVTHRIRKEL